MRVEEQDVRDELGGTVEGVLHGLDFTHDDVPRCTETLAQRAANIGVVLGDKDAHRRGWGIDRRSTTGIR